MFLESTVSQIRPSPKSGTKCFWRAQSHKSVPIPEVRPNVSGEHSLTTGQAQKVGPNVSGEQSLTSRPSISEVRLNVSGEQSLTFLWNWRKCLGDFSRRFAS